MKTILGHAETKRHIENLKPSGSKQSSIKDSFKLAENDPTKVAELKLAVFISEHASTLSVDHLGELVSQLDKKSSTLQKIKLHRTKCARLQKYVLAPSFAQSLRNEIGDQYYSLIVDESTNEANITCLGLSIRFYSAKKRSVVDTFYRLVPLKDTTADTIYTTLKGCLEEDGLDLNKLIGIGTDGASAMVGKTHSLSTLLKKDNPELTLVRCVCHSLHLAAAKACDLLPTVILFLVRETHNWFSNSPKRMHTYKELYKVLEGCDSVPKKVPGLSATRWLARLEAITVILDEWDALKLHFEISASNERCHTTKELANAYKDPQTKLYLLFLRKILKEIVRINKLFQSQNVDIAKITDDLMDMYRSLMQVVVDSNYLSKCSKENLPNLSIQSYILPHTVINFGYEFNSYAQSCSLSSDQISCVKERCKNFMLELLTQVQQRLPDNVDILLMLKNFHPSNVTSQCKRPIMPVACRYRSTFTDMDGLENEWENVSFVQWPKECLKDTLSFWAEVNDYTMSTGAKKFPNLSSLAVSLLSLPYSNASIERIFSQMNVVHSKLRNRLSVRSVEAILQIRYGLALQSLNCSTFVPSSEMIRNFGAKDSAEDEANDDIISIDIA